MNNYLANKPSKFAWFVFRCLARYLVSLFIPCFKHFGETNFNRGAQVFITKNFGLPTWLLPLAIFKKPLRFVIADTKLDPKWYNMALSGGLNPILLSGAFEEDYKVIKGLIENKEKIILVISQNENDSLSTELTKTFKKIHFKETLFMAVSGADKVFENNSKVPKVVPVTMLCAMPFMPKYENNSNKTFTELNFLEKASESVIDVSDEPSIFANHKKNL
ncbi:MAG: hypothetical protein PHF29_01015 [Candidatus Riflebacteria bacterium]|nr:hypothetical protein [Candidatus Riflebacteria bacterium]